MVTKKKKSTAVYVESDVKETLRDAKLPMSERIKQYSTSMKNMQEAYPMVGVNSTEDALWRNLTASDSGRDLTPTTQERMRDIAFWLWDSNPMGHRIVEIMSDFVVGDGFTFKAEDEQVQEVLEDFWYDPENNLDVAQNIDVLELSLYGEICFPVWVNPANGHVKLGYLDPASIKGISKHTKNPRLLGYVKYATKSSPNDPKKLKIANVDKNPNSMTSGYMVGECLYYTINRVWSTTRGRSDLLPLADWLDGHDQFLFARLERAFLLNSFIWDIKADGMTKEELEKFVKTLSMPKAGSIRAHNEKITWSTVSPQLESADASQEARLFKNQILGGAGYPEHWFAEGSTTTRATALEMGLPTLKRLRSRQKTIKFMYENMLNFVIDQAIIHGTLPDGVNREFKVIPDAIISRDNQGLAVAVKNFSEGLLAAQNKGWITHKEASDAFKSLLTQCGSEVSEETPPEKETPVPAVPGFGNPRDPKEDAEDDTEEDMPKEKVPVKKKENKGGR